MACKDTGLFIVTFSDVRVELRSPLQLENLSLEEFAVTFDGSLAETATVELTLYQLLGVVVPLFWLTNSRY